MGQILTQPQAGTETGSKPTAARWRDLSASDLDQAAKQDTPVLALRFRHDPVCPPERLDTIGAPPTRS